MGREPFLKHSKEVIEICASGKARGYLASHTILNVFYITRTKYSVAQRIEMGLMLFDTFEIIDINCDMIIKTLKSIGLKDLEDGLQMRCATDMRLNYIITRDIKDFDISETKALLPEEFLLKFRGDLIK
jgi:hypothetical protein